MRRIGPGQNDIKKLMARIFTTLAVIIILSLAASIAVGFLSMSLEVSETKKDIFLVHFFLGLGTTLVILLVHCIIFTYFLGTGRWVKEVGLAYRLRDEHLPKLTRELKRQTFPPALFAMLIAITTVAAGAGTQLQEWPWHIHASLAFLTLFINVWAFRVEWRNLTTNAQVIQEVLSEVDRIRAERGLTNNADALERS
jgi:phosphoglycerol transferase MdoB-like AlkP superfamily enzyme